MAMAVYGALHMIKPQFIDTDHCRSKVHCAACRGDATFRRGIARNFGVPPDFATRCPLDPAPPPPVVLEKPLPPMPVRLSNFGKAVLTVAKEALATGEALVNKRVYVQRLAVCFSCPGKNYRPSDGTCSLCGCFMKIKAWLVSMKCDADYWGKPVSTPAMAQRVPLPGVIGQKILEHELDIRNLLPPESLTVKAVNAYHIRVDGPAPCPGCTKGRLIRSVGEAYQKEEPTLDADTRGRAAVLISGAPVADAIR